jgi:hypothetical protein
LALNAIEEEEEEEEEPVVASFPIHDDDDEESLSEESEFDPNEDCDAMVSDMGTSSDEDEGEEEEEEEEEDEEESELSVDSEEEQSAMASSSSTDPPSKRAALQFSLATHLASHEIGELCELIVLLADARSAALSWLRLADQSGWVASARGAASGAVPRAIFVLETFELEFAKLADYQSRLEAACNLQSSSQGGVAGAGGGAGVATESPLPSVRMHSALTALSRAAAAATGSEATAELSAAMLRRRLRTSAPKRGRRTGVRLRSRNEYIDRYLAEEDGADSYADLEDFIVRDDAAME